MFGVVSAAQNNVFLLLFTFLLCTMKLPVLPVSVLLVCLFVCGKAFWIFTECHGCPSTEILLLVPSQSIPYWHALGQVSGLCTPFSPSTSWLSLHFVLSFLSLCISLKLCLPGGRTPSELLVAIIYWHLSIHTSQLTHGRKSFLFECHSSFSVTSLFIQLLNFHFHFTFRS